MIGQFSGGSYWPAGGPPGGRRIYRDVCCDRWRKDIDDGSWDMEKHDHQEFRMEDWEVYGNTVAPTTDLKEKYVIWCPESTLPTRVVYDNKGDAIKAAYAMVSKNPGNRFAVCKVEGVAALQTVQFVDYTATPKKTSKR